MKNSKRKFKNADGSIKHSPKEVANITSGFLGIMWGMDLMKYQQGIKEVTNKVTNITKPKIQRKARIQRRVSVKK